MPVFKNSTKRELERVNREAEKKSIELADAKWILLSDHHRGQKDGADDFLKCLPAYHAALRHYWVEGYTLLLLGDVEELWECFPKNVFKSYHETLLLEQDFAKSGRLIRFWGNHDDLWRFPEKLNRYLQTWSGNGNIDVKEGLNVDIQNQGELIGRLFLLHGHQGSFLNDRISGISRFVVRFVVRNLQRIFKFKTTTSARNYEIKTTREKIIHEWVNGKNHSNELKTILIAGDTHMPVFASKTHIAGLKDDINDLKKQLSRSTNTRKTKQISEEMQKKLYELDSLIARNPKAAEDMGFVKPCYFNTGACSFADGDITGIEISDGQISLVRWPDDDGNPKKKILRRAHLRDVFSKC